MSGGAFSRQLGALLLAAALLLRVAVPAGWMPVASAHGIAMEPCSGHGAMAMPDMPGATAMPDMPGRPGKPGHDPAPAHDMPCGFGAIAETAPPPDAAIAPAPPSRFVGVSLALPAHPRRGSGLGTPPRPSTGPPATA